MAARKKKGTRKKARTASEVQQTVAKTPPSRAKESIAARARVAAARAAEKAKGKPDLPKVEHVTEVVKTIGKYRHWKQQFQADAGFVFRRAITWTTPERSARFEPGTELPEWVRESMGRAKLRRWWESHYIELAKFEDPQQARAKARGEERDAARKKAGKKKAGKKTTSKPAAEPPDDASITTGSPETEPAAETPPAAED